MGTLPFSSNVSGKRVEIVDVYKMLKILCQLWQVYRDTYCHYVALNLSIFRSGTFYWKDRKQYNGPAINKISNIPYPYNSCSIAF